MTSIASLSFSILVGQYPAKPSLQWRRSSQAKQPRNGYVRWFPGGRIAGAPKWFSGELFDIKAMPHCFLMLEALLGDPTVVSDTSAPGIASVRKPDVN
jgi:hypothetical protein